MRSIVMGLRDIVIGAICAGALVALVLGQPLIGLVLGVIGVWQVIRVFSGRASIIGIDQRWADREGKPNIRR